MNHRLPQGVKTSQEHPDKRLPRGRFSALQNVQNAPFDLIRMDKLYLLTPTTPFTKVTPIT